MQNWADKFLSLNERTDIEAAVKNAEAHTSGEIVPVIVRKSSDTYWITPMLALLMTTGFFMMGGFHELDLIFQMRVSSSFAHYGAYAALLILLLLFFGISYLVSGYAMIQRFFVPKLIQAQEVERRALFEFYQNQVNHTHAKTGILIFVSLMEHRVVVLGDQAIASKLPQNTWGEIVDTITEAIYQGKTADGLKNAIQLCGKILAEHFPAQGKSLNELPNTLIIKE